MAERWSSSVLGSLPWGTGDFARSIDKQNGTLVRQPSALDGLRKCPGTGITQMSLF